MATVSRQNALGELVTAVCEANGWSRNDVVRRVVDRGGRLSRSRLGQLCSQTPLEGIQGEKIEDLALGLGIAPARVALAAIRAMGYEVTEEGITPAEAIMRDQGLSEDTRAALLSILRAAGERRRGA